jgi:hypothetical protein
VAFRAPAQHVSDPACQLNWEAIQGTELGGGEKGDTGPAGATGPAGPQGPKGDTGDTGPGIVGTLEEDSSTTAQGPGTLSTDLIYTHVSVTLAAGTWLVYGQATVSTSVADGKQLALHDGTAEITNSAGPVEGAAGTSEASLATTAIVTVAASTTVKLLAKRNGASQLTFGYSGGVLVAEQRITAIRLI